MERTRFDFTETPDLAELYGRLFAHDPNVRKAKVEATGEAMDKSSPPSSKERLIARFLKGRTNSFETSDAQHVAISSSTDIKPHRPTGAPFVKECSPITISDLIVGNTHLHKYLCGRVAVESAYFHVSTRLVLEDIDGDLVEVHIYNIPDASTTKVGKMFPKGRGILLLEPFVQTRSDMTSGIRVENHQDIVDWQFPATCDEWRLLGNSFMNCKPAASPSNALICYNAALMRSGTDFAQKQKDISTVLTNIGICSFHEDNWNDCALYCGAAVHLDLSNQKAWFWLASSLVESANVATDHATRFAAISILKQAGTHFDIHQEMWHPVWQKARTIKLLPKLNDSESWIASFDGEPAWCVASGVLKWHTCACLVSGSGERIDGLRKLEDARKRAKVLFQRNRFTEAKSLYIKCLSSFAPYRTAVQNAAIIASDKSEALLTMFNSKRAPEAMLESMVSALLDRENPRPWLWQARVLVTLGTENMALEHIQSITVEVEKDTTLSDKTKSSIVDALTIEKLAIAERDMHNQCVTDISDVPTEQQQDERDRQLQVTNLNEYISQQGPMIQTIKMMAQLHHGDSTGRLLFGPLSRRNCPKVHIEFPKVHGWPEGIDTEHADKLLYVAHLNGQSNPWAISLLLTKGKFNLDRSDMIKRWHGTGRLMELVARSDRIRKGDILFAGEMYGFDDSEQEYDQRIRASFPNSPCHQNMKLEFGTVHVAVGFNDLDCLVSAMYHDSTDPSAVSEPLTFVGIERSEYSIAKSLVIADLMRHESDTSVVFQVWYSSTWTRPTLESFRRSCQRVLEARALAAAASEKRIQSYLHCWLSCEPLLATDARKRWFDHADKYESGKFSDCCSLHREIDRVAMIAYGLTGELHSTVTLANKASVENQTLDQSRKKATKTEKKKKHNRIKNVEPPAPFIAEPKHLVGSLAMWSVPNGSPPFEGEHVFNHVTLESILKELDESDGTISIVDVFMKLKYKQLQKMHLMLQNKQVIVSLKYGDVKPVSDPGGWALLTDIAALKPQSISWSNLMDYFPKSEFHDIACMCSEPGKTVHYGYTMNWSSQVFGACISDYIGRDQVEVNRILEGSIGPVVVKQARISGLDRLLTLPFFDNPLNLCGYFLMKEVKQDWVNFFGARASSAVSERKVVWKLLSEETLMPFPLHRTTRNIYLSWTYDHSESKARGSH